MPERVRIGLLILLVKVFFIVPLLHMNMVAWHGLAACMVVSLLLVVLAFMLIRPRTPDLLLLLYGQIIEFASVGAWFVIAPMARVELHVVGDVYYRTQTLTWNSSVFFWVCLGGLLQTVFLYFYRLAVRYDRGWKMC